MQTYYQACCREDGKTNYGLSIWAFRSGDMMTSVRDTWKYLAYEAHDPSNWEGKTSGAPNQAVPNTAVSSPAGNNF